MVPLGGPFDAMRCPVASSNRRSALRNRSKSKGERTEPCTVPVSNCMGAVHPVPTVILIHDLLYSSSRKSTSGTPRPRRIAQRQERPAESVLKIQVDPDNRAACLHCLLLYPMCPYSGACYDSVLSRPAALPGVLVFSESELAKVQQVLRNADACAVAVIAAW